jgi:hypothetical protein
MGKFCSTCGQPMDLHGDADGPPAIERLGKKGAWGRRKQPVARTARSCPVVPVEQEDGRIVLRPRRLVAPAE